MYVIKRPAKPSDLNLVDREFRNARKAHHALLEFEDQHQSILDQVSKKIDPSFIRLAGLVGRLRRRFRARHEDIRFNVLHGRLNRILEEKREHHRQTRNQDPRWQAALGWADEPVGAPKRLRNATKDPSRGKNESLEDYRSRLAKIAEKRAKKFAAGNFATRTRREQYTADLYKLHNVRSDTWNDLGARIKLARKSVLKLRNEGRTAAWKHPKWFEGHTLVFKAKACIFKLVERSVVGFEGKSTTLRFLSVQVNQELKRGPKGEREVRGAALTFEVTLSNSMEFDLSEITEVRLSRFKRTRLDHNWRHTASILLDKDKGSHHTASSGWCGIDTGHREHGHDGDGLRAAYWYGSDGQHGQVLLPVRPYLDKTQALQADLDLKFDMRLKTLGQLTWYSQKKQAFLAVTNRHQYRTHLANLGVRSIEQDAWLCYEKLTERQIAKARRRVESVRLEVYNQTIRELSKKYHAIGLEDIKGTQMRRFHTASEFTRRKRQNRDAGAPYLLKQICERSGAKILPVPARKTSQVCPHCVKPTGKLEGLILTCPNCGLTYDRDFGAAKEICRRTGEALAKTGVSDEYDEAAQ